MMSGPHQTSRFAARRLAHLVLLLAGFPTGCARDSLTTPAVPRTGLATLVLGVSASGMEIDDIVSVWIGDHLVQLRPGYRTLEERVFNFLPPGAVSLSLSDMASNCTATPERLEVLLEDRHETRVQVHLHCRHTGTLANARFALQRGRGQVVWNLPDGYIDLFDGNSPTETITGHSAAWSGQGGRLAVVERGRIRIRDMTDPSAPEILLDTDGRPEQLAWSPVPGGPLMFTNCVYKTYDEMCEDEVWLAAEVNGVWELRTLSDTRLEAPSWSLDGTMAVAAGPEMIVAFESNGAPLGTISTRPGEPRSPAFASTGRVLYVEWDSPRGTWTVRELEVSTGQDRRVADLSWLKEFSRLQVLSDGRLLIGGAALWSGRSTCLFVTTPTGDVPRLLVPCWAGAVDVSVTR